MLDSCRNLRLKSFKIQPIGSVAHTLDDNVCVYQSHETEGSETDEP